MKLRPYQQEFHDDVVAALSDGESVLGILPTGGGKSWTTMQVVRSCQLHTSCMVHTRDLVDQLSETARAAGLLVGDSKSVPGEVCIRVDTVQARWDHLVDDHLLIIDEAHRAAAPSYIKQIEAARAAQLLLLTATPERADARSIAPLVHRAVEPVTTRDLMEQGYLVREVRYYQGQIPDGSDQIPLAHGEYKKSAVAKVYQGRQLVGQIAEAWKSHWPERRGVVFCATVEQSAAIARDLNLAGIPAVSLSGKSKGRKETLDMLRDGWFQAVTCADLLIEGVDIPDLSLAVFARKVRSMRVACQALGRVMRPSGMADAVFYDLGDTIARLGDLTRRPRFDLEEAKAIAGGSQPKPKPASADMVLCEKCWAWLPTPPRPESCSRCGHKLPAPPGPKTKWVQKGARVVEIAATPPIPRVEDHDLKHKLVREAAARHRDVRWAYIKYREIMRNRGLEQLRQEGWSV